MRKFPRFISRQISRCISADWLLQLEFPCFLPFYHVVSDKQLPHILNYPYRNRNAFEKELDFFLQYFKPVSLEELVSGSCAGKKVFHLTFDDGLRECSEIIAPVLLKKGIPATFFINTAFADNMELFHRYKASLILSKLRHKPNRTVEKILAAHLMKGDRVLSAGCADLHVLRDVAMLLKIDYEKYLRKKKPYLTWEQIKQLAASGFTIGAHSHTHPEFWKLTAEDQLREVKVSMDKVVEVVNPAIKAFSFPYTDSGVPADVLKTIRKEGICDITFGTAGIKYDQYDYHFQRYPVELPGDFLDNLKTEIVYFELRKWVGKATVKH
jgi:peptidoglycan/xylan/chitin deacetylase (PgdA/CDA1 family)